MRLKHTQVSGVAVVQYCRQDLMLLRRLADYEDLAWLEIYRRVHANVLLAAVRLMNYHAVLLKHDRSCIRAYYDSVAESQTREKQYAGVLRH